MPGIARWADWPAVIGCRRAVGLWAFSYATTHFGFFVIFLLGWDMARLGSEIVERPYILVGFNAGRPAVEVGSWSDERILTASLDVLSRLRW